jgi:copper transport protein
MDRRDRVRAAFVVTTLVLAISFLMPVTGSAHGGLTHSSPAAGERLEAMPRELRLAFTEAVSLALTRIELRGPDGALIALATTTHVPDSANLVVARIEGPLVAGSYEVGWQITGHDGHPVRGSFRFTIETTPLPTAEDAESVGPSAPEGPVFGVGSPLYAAVRLLGFAGLLGLVGVVSFELLVLRRAVGRGSAAMRALVESTGVAPARLGLVLAYLLGIALVLRLVAQGYALGGGGFDGVGLRAMLTGTPWGVGWILQAIAVVVAGLGLHWASQGRAGAWVLAAGAVVLLGFTPGLSGHAVAVPGRAPLALLADAGHLLGAGGWLGSLLVVLGIGIPAALKIEERHRGPAIAEVVNTFSVTALIFAGLVVVTGVVGAWIHLGSVPALWQTDYGRVLLIKLAVLSLVLMVGSYNFLRIRPRLGDAAAVRRLRRSSTFELGVGVLVLLVTAVLVALPTPRSEVIAAETLSAEVKGR